MTALLCADPTEVVEQRLETLLDAWTVIDRADGVLVVTGRVGAQEIVAFATDPAVQGGALGEDSCRAIAAATDRAADLRLPIVGVWHSGGARLREGVAGLSGVGRLFAAQTRASGVVPQISIVLGPAAGGAAYGPALTDVVVLGPEGRVFVTGPSVIKSVTGEDVDMDRLGGSLTAGRSGVAHLCTRSEWAASQAARTLVGLLGSPGRLDPSAAAGPDPGELVPESHRQPYAMQPVLSSLLDAGTFLELQSGWAPNAVVGLGRLAGRTVGVVANDPRHLAGCLDTESGDKTGRFVQWCDALGVPLVFVVDVPGYLPGVGQEDGGVVRRGAKLLHAYAAATVPRVTVVLRKAYGGAFIAMGSKGLGADTVLAWPGAQMDVMGASAAVEVLHRRALAAEPDPQRRAELVEQLATDHLTGTGGLERALSCGAVDAVIEPRTTRLALVRALLDAPTRLPRAHRNPPL